MSIQTLQELKEVLSRDKFSFIHTEEKFEFIELLTEIASFSESKRILNISEHESDNRFLELAEMSSADYIVSSDSHLLKTKKTKIISVNQFHKIM